MRGTLDLDQTYQRLTGRAEIGGKSMAVTDGRLRGTDIEFTLEDGRKFRGRVDGGRMQSLRAGRKRLAGGARLLEHNPTPFPSESPPDMTASDTPAAPRQTLSTWDGVAFIVGVVVGIGIFRLPSLVASGVSSEAMFIGVWLLGGVVMLVGALCYAELGSAHPDAGGEYHFLTRAFGWRVGVLFAWARGTVIQTGAIAAVAFVYADYASNIVPLGTYSAAIHAVIGVVAVTALNLTGTAQGVRAQLTLTTLTILALLAVIVAGFSTAGVSHPPVNPASQWGSIGLAMVFVMFAYGGWNEAAYLSGELKDVKRNMVRTLLLGTAVVVALYALANLAYLNVFGLEGLRKSSTVGA